MRSNEKEFQLRLREVGSGYRVSHDDAGKNYTVKIPVSVDGDPGLSGDDLVPLLTVDLPGRSNPRVMYTPGRNAVRKARLKKAAKVVGAAAAAVIAIAMLKSARAGQQEAERLRRLGFRDEIVTGGQQAVEAGTAIGTLIGGAVVALSNDQMKAWRQEDSLPLSDQEIGRMLRKAEFEGYYSLEDQKVAIFGPVRFSDLKPAGTEWW
jgi:hypothetical protein